MHGYRGNFAASDDWMSHAYHLASRDPEQHCGVLIFGIDLALHRGMFGDAVAIGAEEVAGSQWTASYSSIRAEAFVRVGHPDAAEAIAWAQSQIGQDPYARGILLRARGLHEGDESLIRDSLATLEETGSPFQAARTGWLLGGDERDRAAETFERLGATLPAD
jgi:hypothetical protein